MLKGGRDFLPAAFNEWFLFILLLPLFSYGHIRYYFAVMRIVACSAPFASVPMLTTSMI